MANGYNVSLGGSLGTAKSITVEGREFAAWGEAATFYGVDPRVFALRISRLKWTPEEAAGLVKRTRYARMQIDVGGVSFPSLRAAAGHFGVDYKLAHDRMKSKGWTLEEALGLTPRTRRRAK